MHAGLYVRGQTIVRRFVYQEREGGDVGGASTGLGAGLRPYVCCASSL